MKLGQKGLAKYTQKIGAKVGSIYDKLAYKNYYSSMLPSNTHDYQQPINSTSSPLEKKTQNHY